MKQLLFITALLLCIIGSVFAQDTTKSNVKLDSNGNYVSITNIKQSAKLTGKYYINKDIKYPVYISKNNKLFIILKSKKTGKEYNKYLKL